jgi:hypothetical protein
VARKKLSERERKRRQRRSAHNTHLKKTYGITYDEYELILASQGGKCVCGGGTSKRHFATDHNHGNGRVRGLLCANCNKVLAIVRDNPERLRLLATYLERDGLDVRRVLGRDARVPEEETT